MENDNVKLHNNYNLAYQRLMSQKKRFVKDPELFEKYKNKIHEFIDDGYAEVIPENSPTSDKTWYIPHHSTGSKFRVVFDGRSEFDGTSLNKSLLQGPDLNNSLIGVLIQFRQYACAYSSDIKAMFHRVLVSPDDSDALGFLWFENDDVNGRVIQLKLLSHTFGLTSSPCVASYALHKVAEDNPTNTDPSVLEIIRRSFYVDDCLHSVDSVPQAIESIKSLVELLKARGFTLTKFMSNKMDVLESVPEQNRAPPVKVLDLESCPAQRTLGVAWNMSTDHFEVSVNLDSKPNTRRGYLGHVSKIYDPLGFVQPFLLPARRILQDLCSDGYCWDDEITGNLKDEFEKWLAVLPELNKLTVPRCYKPEGFVPKTVQLHVFCDTSKIGYGAVAYLRLEDVSGSVHCAFVKGASRVSPKKPVTIPRLELIAAVSAVELGRTVLKELDYAVDDTFYWSDSLTVLYMLNNCSRRLRHLWPIVYHLSILAQKYPSGIT